MSKTVDAAKILGVSTRKVQDMALKGELFPYVRREGRRWVYDIEGLTAWTRYRFQGRGHLRPFGRPRPEPIFSEDELLPLPPDIEAFFDGVCGPGKRPRSRHAARIAHHKEMAPRLRTMLRNRVSRGMYNSLRGTKNGVSWELLVGYTTAELRAHLEAKFAPGMGWHNMGEWHIDHIRPLASFNITSPQSPDFREAWALTNLQPLWAADNIRKGARWSP